MLFTLEVQSRCEETHPGGLVQRKEAATRPQEMRKHGSLECTLVVGLVDSTHRAFSAAQAPACRDEGESGGWVII